VLDRAACLVLMATHTLGRLVFTRQALPDVLPAQYHLDHENLLIRLAAGSPAAVAAIDAVVAFETDDFDPDSGTGWSVTVVGQARQMPGDGSGAVTASSAWGRAGGAVVLCLPTVRLTGHRMVVTSPDRRPRAS
jgi:hypothetical protein